VPPPKVALQWTRYADRGQRARDVQCLLLSAHSYSRATELGRSATHANPQVHPLRPLTTGFVALAAGAAALASPPQPPLAGALGAPDSVVHAGVVFRGRLTVVQGRVGRELEIRVAVRSLRADTVTLRANASNCHPPLRLRRLPDGRPVAWSEMAWRAAEARRTAGSGPTGYGCSLRLAVVAVGPGASAELEPRRYPLRAVRGDSLRPGWYAAAVDVDVSAADTLRVPAGRVPLP
jgi:hypothetical protein